jgi:hypothetical protein
MISSRGVSVPFVLFLHSIEFYGASVAQSCGGGILQCGIYCIYPGQTGSNLEYCDGPARMIFVLDELFILTLSTL